MKFKEYCESRLGNPVTTWVRDEKGRDWGWNLQFGKPNKINLEKLVTGTAPLPPFAILWKYMQSGDRRILATYGDVPPEEIERLLEGR